VVVPVVVGVVAVVVEAVDVVGVAALRVPCADAVEIVAAATPVLARTTVRKSIAICRVSGAFISLKPPVEWAGAAPTVDPRRRRVHRWPRVQR
jgi:hypothetical protein